MAAIRFQMLGALGAISLIAAAAAAQDFHKQYGASGGGAVIVHNVSGDVIVKGYDGAQIIVDGVKTGKDRNMVSVEDLSQGDRVELRARYPRNCECDASIKFEIQVPRSVQYTLGPLSTASGDISVADVTGQVSVRSASGDIAIQRT